MTTRAAIVLAVGLCAIAAIGLFLRPDPAREVAFHGRAAAETIAEGERIPYETLERSGSEACIGAAMASLVQKQGAGTLRIACEVVDKESLTLTIGSRDPVTHHFPHGWSLAPPLLAILFAFALHRVIPALGIAIVAAAFMAADGAPVEALGHIAHILEPSLTSPFNLSIYAFTVFLIGMVGIQLRTGGLDGLIDVLARRAGGRRSAQAATAVMGGAVFFDDYANAIVVGASARPLTDRFRISREKLAYLVDSTAAPISGIAIVSTWIGFEVGLFQSQADLLQSVGNGGYGVFFAILPYRFYCILALIMVGLVAGLGRDFGPMLRAERRAASGGGLGNPGGPAKGHDAFADLGPIENSPRRPIDGILPIVVVLFGVLGGYGLGGAMLMDGPVSLASLDWWQAAFSAVGDAMDGNLGAYVLLGAAVAGALAAALLGVGGGTLSVRDTAGAFGTAVKAVLPTLVILALAIAIRNATELVHADWFLVSLLGDVDPVVLPFSVFLLAAVTSFSTGTAWGTMGILLPVVVPLVYAQTVGVDNGALILGLCLSAVLDGAIFGDHCSPISDTTVMSSMASSCDHMDHVRTQIPYALLVMAVAGAFGYTLVAWAGTPAVTSYLIGAAALAIFLLLVGRKVETA